LEVFAGFPAALDGCSIHRCLRPVDKATKAGTTVRKAKPS
jgi:hypothetical protein